MPNDAVAGASFNALYETIKRLRSPGGCPWDREQTPKTLRSNLIEESYECIEAIDEGDASHIKEELGDIFLVVVMLSYMHEQSGLFSVSNVFENVNEKLIRRHPHVFSDVQVKDSEEVLKNWQKIKEEKEGRKPKDSILDEVSRALPPLERAFKLQKKAAKIGFDWPDIDGIWAKIDEESSEVQEAARELAGIKNQADTTANGFLEKSVAHTNLMAARSALENECGDLLFAVINLCRFLQVDPQIALRRTNTKFENRFKYVEKNIKKLSKPLPCPLDELDHLWNEAKKQNL
ncbi:MAG: nucleoside triphosphate pyrophosphohydrolase [Spirochaetaceae bacterium]|jgi:tetrapyrrole methylase family protein/MazG family protein|nr:nucleoside triphosphate pyrophosphohydrolase [Spirochaetaceae bacterium]